jgi:L-fuculose-phosphate aldolase
MSVDFGRSLIDFMEPYSREIITSIVQRAVLECVASSRLGTGGLKDQLAIFTSPEAYAIKQEMVRTGRKLWERQYVDGNGGNITVRISPDFVLCTPTLCSKGDLQIEDIGLVDMSGNQICGVRSRTSEILLHLEIYKLVPRARAVIHCHPAYATAHAVAGVSPPPNLIPEQEVFVGPVAISPYETPGSPAFAETILPYAKKHNTILLANHGIVCWADTATHAEWFVEVVETYCKTVMLARQLNPRLNEIPFDKIADLLELKKRLGLPDARFPDEAEETADELSWPDPRPTGRSLDGHDFDQLVQQIASEVCIFLDDYR